MAGGPFDEQIIKSAVRQVLQDGGIDRGEVSVAVVDDATIHEINRQFLCHDCPTDVISFVLERHESHLEGEIVASLETAIREAPRAKSAGYVSGDRAVNGHWSVRHELLLYIVHGALHLVGYDDTTDDDRRLMTEAEEKYLARVEATNPFS